MTTSARRLLLAIMAGTILLSGCTSSTGARAETPGGSAPTASASSVPGGGGDDGSVGSGVVSPPSSAGPTLPGLGEPTMVVPKPGRLDVHPVGASSIEARVDGRRVRVTLSWWSGVEPCSVLDSVAQVPTGSSIALTILEGADRRDVACIEIAMLKATLVDLGDLEPGVYTITAGGDAAPVRIVVH